MTAEPGGYGIVATGHALGEPSNVADLAPRYTKDLQKIQDWGYRTFHRAGEGTGLTDLAAAAGRRALERAEIGAEHVDLVVLAMADIAEYLYWDPAAAVQGRLGSRGAEAVLANQACSAGVVAFDLIAGKFATHPEYRVALLVAANRVCETYWNRMESNTSIASDGAAAAVLVRGHAECQWLATEVITEGRYAHILRLPGGGAAHPFTGQGPGPGIVTNPFDRMEDHFVGDVRAMLQFSRQVRTNIRDVVLRACQRASVAVELVRYVLHLNDNIRALTSFAEDIGIEVGRTNAEISMDHGHLGAADQIFAMGKLLDEGRLEKGDVVALTSSGAGMHWAATLLRV